VTKLDYADPLSLSFATTPEGSTSTDSPKTVTVENGGNATLTFPTPATGSILNIFSGFTLDLTTTCPQLSTNSTPGMLDPNAACTYAVDFSPTTAGNLSGSLVLTDNALNAPSPSYATQSITLSGTATAAVGFSLASLNSSTLTDSSNITVSLGASGTMYISVMPVGGFTGNVALTAVFTTTPPGTTVVPILSLSPTSISVLNGASGSALLSTLTINDTTATAYFGTGTGAAAFNFQPLFWSPGYNNVVPEDVNGDGKVDVILYDSSTGTEYTGISNGNGSFSYIYNLWGTGTLLAQ